MAGIPDKTEHTPQTPLSRPFVQYVYKTATAHYIRHNPTDTSQNALLSHFPLLPVEVKGFVDSRQKGGAFLRRNACWKLESSFLLVFPYLGRVSRNKNPILFLSFGSWFLTKVGTETRLVTYALRLRRVSAFFRSAHAPTSAFHPFD